MIRDWPWNKYLWNGFSCLICITLTSLYLLANGWNCKNYNKKTKKRKGQNCPKTKMYCLVICSIQYVEQNLKVSWWTAEKNRFPSQHNLLTSYRNWRMWYGDRGDRGHTGNTGNTGNRRHRGHREHKVHRGKRGLRADWVNSFKAWSHWDQAKNGRDQ